MNIKHTSRRLYRFVANDKSYATRWRVLTDEGVLPPSQRARERLGGGYSCEIKPARVAALERQRTRRSASPAAR